MASQNWSSGSSTIGGLTYTYPAQNAGQISRVADTVSGETITYQYDALKRLTSATSSPNAGSSATAWTQTFSYDGFGNLTGKTPGSAIPAIDPATNRFTGTMMDANGNLISGAMGTMTYDGANRLASVTPMSGGTEYYGYAPDNKRIYRVLPKGTEEWTLYGVKGEKLATYGTQGWSFTSTSVWFAGKLVSDGGIGEYPAPVLQDRLGTNRAGGGRFYPYGEEIGAASANDRVKFGSYRRDGFSGLDYADQRFYASTYGRFNTADPYMASGGVSDPGSWNRYSYTRGDPVNRLDRHGLADCNADFCGEGTAIADRSGIGGAPAGGGGGNLPDLGSNSICSWELPDCNADPTIFLAGSSNTPVRVANFSTAGPNQNRIASVLGKIQSAISADGECSGWLQGGGIAASDLIAALLDSNHFGHGTFNVNTVAAFAGTINGDGSPTGVSVDAAFTVNDSGAFFAGNFKVGARAYAGGALQAQASILVHELAHALRVRDFKADFGDADAGRANDKAVDQNCGRLIGGLK